jgi:hypothetical protein
VSPWRRGALWKCLVMLGVTATSCAFWMEGLHRQIYLEWVSAALVVVAAVVGPAGTIWTRRATLALAAVVPGLRVGWEIAEISYSPPIDGIWNRMALIGRNLIAPLRRLRQATYAHARYVGLCRRWFFMGSTARVVT